MGKNSKREEAQQAMNRRLQKQREAMELQKQQNRLIRNTMLVVLAFVLIAASIGVIVTGCNRKKAKEESKFDTVSMTVTYTNAEGVFSEGTIVLKLYEDIAPITVKNFRKLVSEGFYNGLTFHRIYSGFMIQGGDPDGDGSGGSATTIKGEFSANGFQNPLSHKRGVISMARGQSMDSASSQFFIMHKDSLQLDGQYAAFGEVISGMDVVDAIAETQVEFAPGSIDRVPTSPVNPVTIVKAELVNPEA